MSVISLTSKARGSSSHKNTTQERCFQFFQNRFEFSYPLTPLLIFFYIYINFPCIIFDSAENAGGPVFKRLLSVLKCFRSVLNASCSVLRNNNICILIIKPL